jgi:TolB-like protein/tetratricopeptide (TPR) repeat protein
VVAIMTLLVAFWALAPRYDAASKGDIRSIAVLPLSNLTGDSGQGYYADGLQDILITELSQIGGLRVTSRQSTKRYRDSQLSATDIAEELGVDALVEGSLLSVGSNIEVTIQLINSRTDEHIWAKRYARETPYALDLIADMATAIGTEIVSAPEPGSERLSDDQAGPVDPRAIHAYSLGLAHLDRFTLDEIRFAIDQFQRAVTIEPAFALAWGHLAVAHAMHALYGYAPPRESIEKARTAALKAIEADDGFYIGYSTLGWVRLWTGDFDGACDSFEYALQLNHSAPYALHGDADCLMLEGRMEESIVRTRELLMVAPFSGMHNRPLPYHLFLARRYEESIAAAMAMQKRVSGFSMHWFLAQIYWKQGLLDKALEEERQELEWRKDRVMLAALEEGLEAAGPIGAMRAMADTLVARASESYVDPFKIAEAFARAESVDETFYWLDKAVDDGSYEIIYLAFQPDFDVLRDDPRYQELLKQVYGSRAMQYIPRR